jgi:hypothetical protein
MRRIAVFLLAPATVLALLSAAGQAGNKSAAFKPFLPDSAYAELSKRSLERIGMLAKNDKAPITELRAEALILTGFTRSTKDRAELAPLRETAIYVAGEATKNKAGARSVAADLAAGKPLTTAKVVKDWPALIGDIKDVMMTFANQAKGGAGVSPELHYSAKVKNQNGSEALVNALAAKKLTDANVKKMSRELELLAYRVAVIGALTIERGPADKTADVKLWNEQAVIMRDSAIELAEAAHKKDGPAILEACKKLENSCVDCHSNFK